MNKLIYAADDEEDIRNLIAVYLKKAGFDVQVFATGDALYDAFLAKKCDLVILDIMMPGTDGLGICKKLRAISKVPIVILTAKESEVDYMMGLTLGGDDYIIKPFRPSIFVMRIKALLRRMDMEHEEDAETLTFGDLIFSGNNHSVTCKGHDLGLSMTEIALMQYMMKNPSHAFSRDELLSEVWGIHADIETRVTDETIRRIRKKLKKYDSSVSVTAIWGYGYKLEQKS